MSSLLERCTLPPAGSPIDCAVSGGADSLALLVLATQAGCDVTAWHVDHGLRPSTDHQIVEAAATRYGARFELVRLALRDGPNLEARARTARFDALPDGVCTGHTADDQAETVLLALLRGAGMAGLAGMAPERHPLLALRRSETVALCAAEGLTPAHDPTNDDPRFRRNRVRHELLPLACDIADRDVVPLLVRTAVLMRAENAPPDLDPLDPTDAVALAHAPVAAARRAVRRWLANDGYPPSAAAVERVLAVARGDARGCEVAGVGRILRTRQRLRLERSTLPGCS